MGQFGLGTDILSEIKRPRLHVWVEEKNKDGELGPQGIEMIAAGGMHTVAVDSRGYVSVRDLDYSRTWPCSDGNNAVTDLHLGHQ